MDATRRAVVVLALYAATATRCQSRSACAAAFVNMGGRVMIRSSRQYIYQTNHFTLFERRSHFSAQCTLHASHPRNKFVEEVITFLRDENLHWRYFTSQELIPVMSLHLGSTKKQEYLIAMLESRTILAVGKGTAYKNTNLTFSFLLHLCPTPNFVTPLTEEFVASYAWLNAHLTSAFANEHIIVHLHEDVWNRSPDIIRSRLRSKCGLHNKRIFARQTRVKRIPKSEYLTFLERNHLYGALSSKYAYGLYTKVTSRQEDEKLVAVATFSNKRKIKRASTVFHSYELLRFCTEMDSAVVGGLSKIISAFVKEVRSKVKDGECDCKREIGIDIVTSIDRDFGTNSWPNFICMDVMKPLPMFVGDDGIRRHAVGVGLTPFDNMDAVPITITTSLLLRLGLPLSLLEELEQYNEIQTDQTCWDVARNAGFRPVFDAGVERLMLIVDDGGTNDLKPESLWNESTPRFVTDHYSKNPGVEKMINSLKDLKCTRMKQRRG